MNALVILAAAFSAAAGSGMLAASITGFAPMFALRMFMLIYPPGDERPAELLAEMHGKKKLEQAWWVGQQIATMLFDGIPARIHYVRQRRTEFQSHIDPASASGYRLQEVPDGVTADAWYNVPPFRQVGETVTHLAGRTTRTTLHKQGDDPNAPIISVCMSVGNPAAIEPRADLGPGATGE